VAVGVIMMMVMVMMMMMVWGVQFVLDSAILSGRGADVNILCTQPRRISAVGVSERVRWGA
jgi:hypothetical protein